MGAGGKARLPADRFMWQHHTVPSTQRAALPHNSVFYCKQQQKLLLFLARSANFTWSVFENPTF